MHAPRQIRFYDAVRRILRRKPSTCWKAALTITVTFFAGTAVVCAGTFLAFGPQNYTRGTGAPVTVTNTFMVLNPNTQYTLKAFNGGLQDTSTELVSSGFVTLNGVEVIGPSNFNQNVTEIDVPVTLQASNTISVQVRGQPGGTLTIEIVGVDNDPPTITATASPAANAAGWNNTNVTVTFTCSDATSGVASCPSAQTVTTEGAKQVISGTATDNAGNTASTSVTLNIDKSPPTITASVSPAPNAAGWNNSNVTVSFNCNDSLSGVAACPSPSTVSTEGANQVISGTATDVAGNTASTSATINLDKTPPTFSITSPADGTTVTSSSLTVTGNVSDALSGVSTVTCNGTAATISSGTFSCSLTLTSGANAIKAQAADLAGNTASASESVTFSNNPPAISSFSPASATVGSLVTITGSNFTSSDGGAPLVGLSHQGGGTIDAPVNSFASSTISFVIPAGAATGPITVTVAGQSTTSSSPLTIVAQSTFTLFVSPNSVSLFPGESTTLDVSLASADGFTQLAGLSIAGLPAGVTASFSPQALTAGQSSILTLSAPSTQTAGASQLTITASANIQGISESQSATATLNVSPISGVNFAGRVAVTADPYDSPLEGVTVRFTGTNYQGASTGCTASTMTDSSGNFDFAGLPDACGGAQMVQYDPTTVTSPQGTYSGVTLSYVLTSGQVTTPGIVVHLPRVDNAETVLIQQNASVDQTFNFTSIPNLSMTVYAGTTFTLPDGTQPNPFPLKVVHIPYEQLPDKMPPDPTQNPVFAMSIEPFNSTSSQPVAVSFPNRTNAPAGTTMPLTTLNPTLGMMVNYGTGTVSGDGSQVIPDPDPGHPGHRYGISHFDWHFPLPGPNPTNPCPAGNKCAKGGDAVDLASGILTITKTDIAFGGARGQLAITRTYRTLTTNPGPFGIGTNHNYSYIVDTTNANNGVVQLIMPDGNEIPFVGPSGTGPFANSTVPSLFGAVITTFSPYVTGYGSGYSAALQWKDGTVYQFKPLLIGRPGYAFLMSITDANGNATTFTHGGSVPMEVTQITDPVGRLLNLTYDGSFRITSITDPIGRKVSYTYNSQGTLATVTDVNGGVTSYTYDSNNDLLSITDPRGITFLQNTYDSNRRVVKQADANNGVMTFAYTLLNPAISYSFSASGASTASAGGAVIGGTISNVNTSPVVSTIVTDALGNATIYHFNPQGFVLDVTDALGEKTVYTTATGTNQLQSITDPLGRTTAFTYDANGNTTSITRLAGTSGAVTTSLTYDPNFNKVTTITDPLGHTTTFKYDQAGNLLSVTDPLSEQTSFAYDSNGELTSSTDPLGNTTQFAYSNGDLVRITDPLGRVTMRTTDGVDRLTALINPLGQASSYQYGPLNELTQVTDPLNGATSFTYDGNGNLLSVTDAKGNKTAYTYENMDRLATRTDPLTRSESYQYDLDGNLTQFTDRRGVVTNYSYDALNRRTQANVGGQETISYAYDAGGRLIQAADSITGTIARSYDGLDRLVSETTPQGNVGYSYDAAGRRAGMTVGGQQPVSYSYDNGNRLIQIAQGTSKVSFSYDSDGRRTSLTLPNGVTMTYSYDAASRLTAINYGSLGNLTYSYDLAGRRMNVGGTFARTGMPAALTSASYNADNQLTQFGPSNLTYDANGNLTSDGTNTYTWSPRNQLVSIGGGVSANFQYDAFGRRVIKTVGGTRQYFYDGLNPVEELSGTTVTATMLTGVAMDEYFQRADASGAANFLTDALGSTLALMDSAGVLQTQYAYEPFGNTALSGAATTNSFAYTGRELDATGLYYYRARYYDPKRQRFISEDPFGLRGGSPNFYPYVLDNPTDYKDPLGDTTVNLGGNISISVEGVNIFNYTGGVVIDSNGNIAIYNTFGGGAAVNTGLSGSLSLTGGASSGRTVCSFGGPFVEVGGNAGLGPGGGASGYLGFEKDGTPIVGGSVSAGVGGGAEAFDDITKTFVTPLFGRKISCQ